MRLNRVGVIAGAIYLALGLLWIWLARPDGGSWWPALWFILVALFGAFIPGEANQVSLSRAYLAAPALTYSLAGWLGPVAVVAAVASLTDLVDGTVARRFQRPTTLGGGLDPVVDGLFMGALAIGLAVGGVFPMWLALVVIARYLLPAVGGAVLILILLGGVCLFRGLNQDSSGLVAAAEVVIPLATVATYLHLAWVSRRPVTLASPG